MNCLRTCSALWEMRVFLFCLRSGYCHATQGTQVLLNSWIQCNKSCTNVHELTLTQKYSFNHIFKLGQKKWFLDMLFVGFMEDGFALLSLLKTFFFFLHSSDCNRLLTDVLAKFSVSHGKLIISSSWVLCTDAHCHWIVTVRQWVTEGLSIYVSTR